MKKQKARKNQTEFIATKLKEIFSKNGFDPCLRRNGHPSPGWNVVGDAGLTRAIKLSGLPWDRFWSGKNPTPSTQAPIPIIIHATRLKMIWHLMQEH